MHGIPKSLSKFAGVIFLISALGTFALLAAGHSSEVKIPLIVLFSALAVYCMGHPFLKSFTFTVWVFVFVAASMSYPVAFGTWFGFDLKFLIVPLIQIITFGMGTTLNLGAFQRVLTMPRPVLIGLLMHFLIMPLAGYGLAKAFRFPPEIAAGVILIGSVSSGVASNVMSYLARGNVALAVTITACSTLMAPVMTPLLMKTLAGRLVPINFVAMMLEILNMLIVPIVAGLAANKILYGENKSFNQAQPLALQAAAGIVLAVVFLLLPGQALGPLAPLKNGGAIGFALLGVVAAAKLIMAVVLRRKDNWMDQVLPIVSMAGICLIIAVITARSRDKLLAVGLALIGAAILHNLTGYFVGYWFARAVKLDESACRTIAFEVGMQNGGMASGLAMSVLQSADAALAPAIFGPWMNISGSILATWWHRKPVRATDPAQAEQEKGV